jgi:prepilin signal peptidase PulO-like enzyme (type II secretory pathway)
VVHEGSKLFSAFHLPLFLLFAVPISLFDIREFRIPDLLSLGGIALFLLLSIILPGGNPMEAAVACAVGFAAFWLIHRLTKGRMGLGDAKLSALVAAAVGLRSWFLALFLASVAGILFVVALMGMRRADRGTRIPFAPFLSLGAVASMFVRIPA